LLGVADLAKHFNVTTHTVNQWIWRAEQGELPPFPAADVEIPTARPDQFIPGWEPNRLREIEHWRGNLPGRGWRAGKTGDVRYTTHQHVGKRPGRTHSKPEGES
jgi:hypothetical protein